MIANVLIRLGAVLAALAMTFGIGNAAENVITFTGEVTYRERIALPPNAQLRVSLVRLSDATTPIVGAETALAPPGQVPLLFSLNVRSDVLEADGAYGLRAEILSGGTVLFRNPQPTPVDPMAPVPVGIIVNLVAETPGTRPDPGAALFDTIWQVRTIDGVAVIQATTPSLSIAADRRAGGHAGCNNYFTEAYFDGSSLGFGPVAGTRMACAPAVMAQEAALFKALEATASFEITGSKLYLLDGEGNAAVQLVRGQ